MTTYIPIRVGERTALIEKPDKPGCSHPGCQWPDTCKCGYPVIRDGKKTTCGAKLCDWHHTAHASAIENGGVICRPHRRLVERGNAHS